MIFLDNLVKLKKQKKKIRKTKYSLHAHSAGDDDKDDILY